MKKNDFYIILENRDFEKYKEYMNYDFNTMTEIEKDMILFDFDMQKLS